MQKRFLIVLFVLSFLFISFNGRASSVVHVGLEKMSQKAGNIFHGQCTGINVVEDERGLLSTEVTYEIIRSVKGEAGEKITFKVFGAATDEGSNHLTTMTGITRFYPGREDVLFLYEASPWGFTSPIGLWQGDFPVVREDGKTRLVQNNRSYRNAVTTRMTKSARVQKEIITPDDLLDEVEEILQ